MIKLNGAPIVFKHFNDNSCRLVLKDKIYGFNELVWLYDNDEEIIDIYYLISHIKDLLHNPYIKLVMPYVPNARQDRVKTSQDVFTLKYFCNLLNSLNINEIEVFDPHSHVCEALLNRVVVKTPEAVLRRLLNKLPEDLIIAYPDSGSEKRYCSMLRLPYIVGIKERNWEDGTIRDLQIFGSKHMVAGHSILLVDDIASRGSTLWYAARQLKEMGATDIYIYVSHCENTILKPNLNGQSLLSIPNLITKLYTTNSIFTEQHDKIEIIKEF